MSRGTKGKAWFCEECRVMMDPKEEGFYKCPVCGAEAWPDGEACYKQDTKKAAAAKKIHGEWYCQRCRVPMVAADDTYCKCPQCAAEVWYGKPHKETAAEFREMMETTTSFPVLPDMSDIYAAMSGGRPAKRGGAKNGKKRNKANLRKPTTQELYKRLCSS